MPRRRASEPEIVAAHGDLVVQRDAARPTGRLLRQGDMDASYVDLADPRHLEFDYLRWIAALIETTKAQRVIHIGGAACALARALQAGDPQRRQEIVEVDETVLELARRHLGLRRAPGLRVRRADGRAHLATRADHSADAIVIDAFVGARVPRHLVTVEALADAARVAPLVAVNVVDVQPLADARAIAAGLREEFPAVNALGPGPVLRGRRAGNVIVVGAREPLPLQRLQPRLAKDPSPAVVTEMRRGTAWRDSQDRR
jgi:spermidine synthase